MVLLRCLTEISFLIIFLYIIYPVTFYPLNSFIQYVTPNVVFPRPHLISHALFIGCNVKQMFLPMGNELQYSVTLSISHLIYLGSMICKNIMRRIPSLGAHFWYTLFVFLFYLFYSSLQT